MDQFQSHVLRLASLSLALLAALPARGASLQKVNQSEWGVDGLPSYVNLYIYVPDTLATKPPIVVAPHHCQGTGPGTFSEMSSLVSIANTSGFIMIFPEATGQNCWDAGSTRSLKHDGGGDTGAIVQMVKYTLAKYDGDAGRVYSVGGSSGGIMTEALLGVYPDVFMAGVSLMGVPCGCWAEGYNDVTGTGSTAQWSGPCGGGEVTKTGQQWGDLVRSYYPGYTGHRPRLQHWHGTADTILSYKNMAEDVKEWTNLLGLSETPDGTDTPRTGTTRQFWKSACGYTVYEAFSMDGVGHAVPFDGPAVAAYFGIDKAGGQDPETAACPGAVPGGDDTGGAGGAAGAGGAGGAAGTGGAGGAVGAGGAGGVMESGAGGSVGDGGAIGAGSGGANGQEASSGTGGSTGGESSNSGCSCALGKDARDSGAQAGLLLAALGLLLGRPKRRAR
ncbi:extracellular catalytic domain type 1 short-chain-length polyhydroxyalkanoate depolymerase [Sorangium sp. So ce1078]|uniref:extracellular catalytic domain type 1 short-chain-length polyhydroxyalkanoate depolymerase n=1 Tax=Sorangium sp. So ce1078 TaxID=3133329 RepID=UPI003F6134D7